MSKILTPDAQADSDDFYAKFDSERDCTCFISPPCNCCGHPGNPLNQSEDDDAWMDEWLGFHEMEQQARGVVASTIEAVAARHLGEMSAAAQKGGA